MFGNRFSKAAAALSLSTALVFIPAYSASAVTNPAVNPYPITVSGDDGNVYQDGLDTLPGYDDEECTYIPGAYFDFAKNLIHYADGKSIPWSEWERASGYKVWLTNQKLSSAKPTSTASQVVKSTQSSTPANSQSATPEVSEPEASVVPVEAASETDGETPTDLTAAAVEDSNPGRETGLVILGSLAVAGAVILLVQAARRHTGRGGNL